MAGAEAAAARLGEEARRRASEVQGGEMDPAEGLDESWRERLRDRRAWSRVGDRFVAEWRMAGREIAFGFLVAGAIATLVPREVFETVFPGVGPQWLAGVVLHALFALVGLTPDRDVRLAERASFGLDHTFFLNLLTLGVAAVLLGLRRASAAEERAGGPHRPSTRPAKRPGA